MLGYRPFGTKRRIARCGDRPCNPYMRLCTSADQALKMETATPFADDLARRVEPSRDGVIGRTKYVTVFLNPNDFSTVAVLKRDLIRFQERYEKSAKPFEWTFTRRDLHDLLANLNTKSDHLAA
jgi:hypothetical protein